eukprot:TRINITY_DN22478_c0_g2_i1.p1 TRINITY_DN22478_c0_g2~~TRINITY_DN22478_c0_g2_i1.p1  ORF type:complete len:362 (-),score=59.44 TRINITY_DN22478_c0_g2_i1:219-1304(-)
MADPVPLMAPPCEDMIEPIALWSHTEARCGDKCLNCVLKCVSPLASVPAVPDAIFKARTKFNGMSEKQFDAKLPKIGWRQTTLQTPRKDGTQLDIILVYKEPSTPGNSLAPLVLYVHGGGYTIGTPKDTSGTGIDLWHYLHQKHNASAVYASVDYRVAPEHPSPAGIDDCELAFNFLCSSPELGKQYGFDHARMHVWGTSAGGGHALALAAAACRRGERAKVASVMADCPMLNPLCDTPSFRQNERACWLAPAAWLRWSWAVNLGSCEHEVLKAALLDERICPHTAPGALQGVSGLPVVLVVGRADTLHDEGVQAMDAFEAAGAIVTRVSMKATHCVGWMFDPAAAEAAKAKLAELLLAPA